mmetsp:Transcript_6032/g.12705  ORF Transcript_6032/g.12705 Transcript_6032/m.12705 type:complete len:117 (+) Transcript_6032:523-873(+)
MSSKRIANVSFSKWLARSDLIRPVKVSRIDQGLGPECPIRPVIPSLGTTTESNQMLKHATNQKEVRSKYLKKNTNNHKFQVVEESKTSNHRERSAICPFSATYYHHHHSTRNKPEK